MKINNNTLQKDQELLISFMDKAIEGDFSTIDETLFENPLLAQKYNQVIEAFLKSNNYFVMRLNNSMSRIGDSSCVKEMIEQINSQTSSINDMRGSSQEMGNAIEEIVGAMKSIQDNSVEALNASTGSIENMQESIHLVDDSAAKIQEMTDQILDFQEKMEKINEITDMVKKISQKSSLLALNASIEAARAGSSGKGFAVVAGQMQELASNSSKSTEDVFKYVGEIQQGMTALVDSVQSTSALLKSGTKSVHDSVNDIKVTNEQIHFMNDSINKIFDAVHTQSALTQNFVASIETIADSYEILSEECVNTGEHLYRISRDVDKARTDMAKNNSNLSTLDWIKIYEIDHLIFTWRVYNNLADFETLKIEQLNNPKGCKLGKWITAQTDSRITSSPVFREVVSTHEQIHKHACDSWHAKDKGDREEALLHFNLAYECFEKFLTAIHKLEDLVQTF